ncbi:hypothetical protein DIJ64_01110 [Mycobacterium leprae]|uniref:Uncharacterized protein n=2 Tax=Mycobacterium leprae TaxID=1769 RepID=A0AAD0KUV6_MYCLR|nr:hypothetical protein [Mycobacterium leprae]AWV47186.1 hypothetical protein DIJ64_01110 [Mycobacterium leprae]OAR21424.1 hypothetical protein A8144_06430 [Mycobacterium leprae 3125609]OAX71625.1 hypothetical protein A3216_04885 [Mycobacterium leprae 7935681]
MYSWTASRYSSCAARSLAMSLGHSGRSRSGRRFALWEGDGQWIAHAGHQREVQKSSDIEFVVQPPGANPLVSLDEFGQLPAGAFLVGSQSAGCLGQGDLGLLLQVLAL